jgi:predicted nucleic acid-binding protein
LALAKLRAILAQHRRIAIDTSLFIYGLEAYPRFAPVAREVLRWVSEEGSGVASTVTMTEILVKPHQAWQPASVAELRGRLEFYPNLEWIAPDLEIANLAAMVRARHGLRAPDAIIAATAIAAGATLLVTNDAGFRKVHGLAVLILDEIVG